MNMGEIFNEMEWYLNSDFSTYLISSMYKDKFRESFKMLWEHITMLENDEIIEDFDPKNTPRVIEECVNYLMIILSEFNMDGPLKRFVQNYVFITYNWNNNVWKNDSFDYKISYLQRFIEDSLNVSEISSVLNKISCKLSDYKNWLPPAFELSAHYYNLLKED
jgi:uncharacterized protein (UPF0248 family)